MKQVKCESCDGVGNHGKDKRGKSIPCKECNGTGKTNPSMNYWKNIYPDLDDCDIEYLTDRRQDIELFIESSDTHIICLVTNRDSELVFTHRLNPHMDDLNSLIAETSNYEGDWGDYHRIETLIYHRKSYRVGSVNGGSYGNGDVDIATVLPKASLSLEEVRRLLVDALESSDSTLRVVVVNIISRTRE